METNPYASPKIRTPVDDGPHGANRFLVWFLRKVRVLLFAAFILAVIIAVVYLTGARH